MLTTLFMLLTVTGQTPGPSGSRADFKPLPEPNKVAPEFAEILDRSEKAMAALGSFSVKVHVTAILEGPGSKTGSTSTQTILARRPDRFAVIADWAQLGEEQERPTLRVACDGRKLTTYFIPGRLYSEYGGPNPSAQVGHTAIIGSTLSGSGLDVLTRSDMRDFVLRQTSQAELRGKELVDGIDTLKFRVVYAGQELLMWIGPTNQPLLRRLEQTLELTPADGRKLTSQRRADLTWSLDIDIPDTAFSLAIPKAVERVEDIYAALTDAKSSSPVGKKAPALTLLDLDGKHVALNGQKGKPVVLAFWATWAPNTTETLKQIAALSRELGDDSTLFAVSLGDQATKVEERIKGIADLPTVLVDPDDTCAVAFRLKGVPSVVVIGADGVVAEITLGLAPEAIARKIRGGK